MTKSITYAHLRVVTINNKSSMLSDIRTALHVEQFSGKVLFLENYKIAFTSMVSNVKPCNSVNKTAN